MSVLSEPVRAVPSRFADRFWSSLTVAGSPDSLLGDRPDGCWEWANWRDKDGYGILTVSGAHQRAHRVAWTLTSGPIPPGMNVLHTCDNPPCCNPAHLYLGTQADNVADMLARRRRQLLGAARAQSAGQLVLL